MTLLAVGAAGLLFAAGYASAWYVTVQDVKSIFYLNVYTSANWSVILAGRLESGDYAAMQRDLVERMKTDLVLLEDLRKEGGLGSIGEDLHAKMSRYVKKAEKGVKQLE